MDLEDQLAALNPQPGERFSANYILGSDDMVSFVLEPERIPDYIRGLPPTADIWIGVNPVDHTKVPPGKRGKACDVTRLTSLFADLDVKEGGCSTYEVAFDIVSDLAGILGEEPTFIVYSGHGIQPYWIIDPDENWPNSDLGVLLKRWGQLVKLVSKRRGAQADSVFDLARILRAVMTLNNKHERIEDVVGELRCGGPLTLAQVSERLDEAGIHTPEAAEFDPDDDAVPTTDAKWSATECNYCTRAFEEWAKEVPAERHPRLVNWFTRLESMSLLGCLTYAQYQRGAKVAGDRFTALCERGIGSKPRAVKPFEIEDCLDWGKTRAATKTKAQLASEVGKHKHDILGGIVNPDGPPQVCAPAIYIAAEAPDDNPDLFKRIFEAEQDFWSATTSLKMIYDTAMARMVSPWAVLCHCAARMLYLVPSSVKLPALIGGRGSLNWFGIVVDRSGGGKTAASAVAKELVMPMFPVEIVERNPGSGEGIVGQYSKPLAGKGQPPTKREAVMFTTDEIDSLTAMGQRQGGTTLSTLRSAFSGGTLGFSYITKGRDIHLAEHTYRMTFVVNAQPSRTGGLFADHGGGTPQRFQWFPANDPRPTVTTADESFVPAGIPIPHGMALLGDKTISIPAEARGLILSEREKSLHGEQDVLDGHALFVREKFAYALALMDNRVDMGAEDWRLSGIAAEVSSRTRDWAQDELAKSQRVEAEEQGAIRGVGFAAADMSKANWSAQKEHTIKNWIIKKLKEIGPMTTPELRRMRDKSDRELVPRIITNLQGDSMIGLNADGKWYVTPPPSKHEG